jgi:hypothetical protein
MNDCTSCLVNVEFLLRGLLDVPIAFMSTFVLPLDILCSVSSVPCSIEDPFCSSSIEERIIPSLSRLEDLK